jgi:holliday junction DNA helicase RuvA
MIARIEGKIITKDLNSIIVDVGGVGYRIFASNDTLGQSHEGRNISLWTYLAVRENALDLYGFIEKDERVFFELLIGVSGIGPKSAIAILSLAPVTTLKKAITSEDATYLTRVSGIGKKSAQKIIIELKDKLGKGSSDDELSLKEEADALEALKALGYSAHDARESLKKVSDQTLGTNERIKEALRILGK